MIHLIDLNFLNIEKAIGSYLIETSTGPVLIETGPYSTFKTLSEGIEKAGYQVSDIQHVLLTHIHLDHAGSAWAFADHGAKIYLHPFGSRNMEDPSRLIESATRIYGDDMDRLWGTMKKINGDQLISVEDGQELTFGDTTIKAFYTPGHAKHHIAWQLGDIVFTGDVAGVKIDEGPVVPPCPPPDIDLEAWKSSIEIIKGLNPSKLYLTHYDAVETVEKHLTDLEAILDDWAQWMKTNWESGLSAEEITPIFMEYTAIQLKEEGVDEAGVKKYEAANPSWMSVAGLIRYWKKKADQ
ncbi:MAG: MBL fold metallo-hydrolase [Bacteroidota bacterium]